MAGAMSDTSNVKGTSTVDVKAQEIKNIGRNPIEQELKKSPLELAKDDHDRNPFEMNNLSQSVMVDANAIAKKLINLNGLPE